MDKYKLIGGVLDGMELYLSDEIIEDMIDFNKKFNDLIQENMDRLNNEVNI